MAGQKWFTAVTLAETILLASTGLLLAVIAWRLWNWCDAWLAERRNRRQNARRLPYLSSRLTAVEEAALLPLLASGDDASDEVDMGVDGGPGAETGIVRRCRLEATEQTRLLNAYADAAEAASASRRGGYRAILSGDQDDLGDVLKRYAGQQPQPVSPTARCSLFSEAILMEQALTPNRHAVTAFNEDPP